MKKYFNGTLASDGSVPAGYTGTKGNFVGMLVIDDEVNTKKGHSTEGDSSGFVYIVDSATGLVQDYKMLNNHKSSDSGDFSAGFISKHVVDFAWMSGSSPIFPMKGLAPGTGWTVAVTGPDMTKHKRIGTDDYNSTYGLTVKISQSQRKGEDSPQAIMGDGALDNDEVVISGDNPLYVTCMATIRRSDILTPLQLASTVNGGWTRKSIIPLPDAYAPGTDKAKVAKGAIVYRSDTALVPSAKGFVPTTTMQVETGGHLSPKNNHVNRPY